MKFNAEFGVRWDRHGIQDERMGVEFYLNRYSMTVRKRHVFETGSEYSDVRRTHRWSVEWNGLWRTAFLSLGPKYGVEFHHTLKTYAEAVGFDLPIDWILDEFDSSFNELAAASLRYHLEYSVCCNEKNRVRYTDVITRLLEPPARFTQEEIDTLHPPGEDMFAAIPTTPERSAIYAAHRQREDDYYRRNTQARHDFVDLMRELWS